MINSKDQQVDTQKDVIAKLLSNHKAELDAKQDILHQLKTTVHELETRDKAQLAVYTHEKEEVERKHHISTRDLLREAEQRSVKPLDFNVCSKRDRFVFERGLYLFVLKREVGRAQAGRLNHRCARNRCAQRGRAKVF